MKKFVFSAALAVVLAASNAHAGYFASILEDGVNILEDQDREAFVDVNGDNLFGVGDVLLGFARIDDLDPSGLPTGNTLYTLFSQEVSSLEAAGPFFIVEFVATTVAGYTLEDLTGDANAAGGIVATLSAPDPIVDLITTSPGDLDGSGTVDMLDYLKEITDNLTLDVVAGFRDAEDYFAAVTTAIGSGLITGSTAGIATIPGGVTVANFDAGLSVLYQEDANIIFNDEVVSSRATLHELVVRAGTVNGQLDSTNADEWSRIPATGDAIQLGGFATDADILIDVNIVPEPATLTVFAIGLVCCGPLARRRRRA